MERQDGYKQTPEADGERLALKRQIHHAIDNDDLDTAERLLQELRLLLKSGDESTGDPGEEAEYQETLRLLERVAQKTKTVEFKYESLKVNSRTDGTNRHGHN